jgi:hypothetical protein
MRDPLLPSAEVDGAGLVMWFGTTAAPHELRVERYRLSTPERLCDLTPKARIPRSCLSTGDHFWWHRRDRPLLAIRRPRPGTLPPGQQLLPDQCQLTFGFISSLDGGATWRIRQVSGPMNSQWIANTNQSLMVGDYTSTSFTGDGKRTACSPTRSLRSA